MHYVRGEIMIDLLKLGEKTYVLPGRVNIGFYVLDTLEVYVIDTGSSKDYAKNIEKVLKERNWQIKGIINTHSHADHIYGNKYLQDKYGVKVYSSLDESYLINNPLLEPVTLYGANPVEEMKNPFLMAHPSKCEVISDEVDGLKVIDLKGHAAGMIGILTSDDVLFVGDSYSHPQILEKYTIQYIFDVDNFLNTLEYLKTCNHKYYVPSHGTIESEISDVIQDNIRTCEDIKKVILDNIKDEIGYDELLKNIFDYYHIKLNIVQYHLINTTIKSYLTSLVTKGVITYTFANNKLNVKKL